MTDSKKGISIIIPVYNAQKYIEQCVDSLLAQTFQKYLEYIFVIDKFSNDNSEKILTKLAKSNKHVKIIKPTESCGAGYNRNTGIELVQKPYFGFCDADDYVDSDFYEKLYESAYLYDADIVMGGTSVFEDETKTVFNQPKNPASVYFTVGQVFSLNPNNTVWDKIFRTKKYKKDKFFRFPENVIHEDNVFLLKTVYKANKLITVSDTNYNWRRYEGSASMEINHEKYEKDAKIVFDMILNLLNKLDISQKDRTIVIKQVMPWAGRGYKTEEEIKEVKNKIINLIGTDKL